MPVILADTENADRDITSIVTVLTDTPNAAAATICQGYIAFGDGAKDLDGTGGDFELTVTVGGQTIEPNPQTIAFSTAVRTGVWTTPFPVPANAEVILRAKSPNGADTDVDVTAYLYDVTGALPAVAVGGDGAIAVESSSKAIETAVAAQVIRDALKLAPTAGDPASNSVDQYLARIYDDTNTMEVTTLPAMALTGADSDTLETLSDQLDLIGATAGEVEWPYTVSVDGTPQAGALVFLYSDAAYTTLVQQGYTLASGVVTFHITSALNAATKYLKTYAPGRSVQYDTETP